MDRRNQHSSAAHRGNEAHRSTASAKAKKRRRARRSERLPMFLALFTVALVVVTVWILVQDSGTTTAAQDRPVSANAAAPTSAVSAGEDVTAAQAQPQGESLAADESVQAMAQSPAVQVRTGVMNESGEVVQWTDASQTVAQAPAASAAQATAVPATVGAAMPDAAAQPTATPTAAPTAEPEPFQYLPVFSQGSNTDKRIAITIDDCFQAENLRTLAKLVYSKGGKLTIFPIGENINNPNMPETLRDCVKAGFEIENHTWSHARIFRLPEQEMAEEIWKQSQTLNQALGVNYQQHFFRLMGGDGMNDQRIHNYLDQLGFKGIAWWSLSGSDAEYDEIKASLKPGMIYLFHTTDRDTGILKQFIPYVISEGYQLVTMNELLGFEENAITELTTQAMPQPRPYTVDYATHKQEDYAWIIVQMQDKLREMGYLKLDGASTGYYGKQTVAAVEAFQRDHGLTPTGTADAKTQKMILGVEG